MKTLFPVSRRWPLLALLLLLGVGGLAGCASDKNLVAHSFNNIAARDNAYFLAREKLNEIETKLFAGRVDDYNQVLPLFPTLDSAAVKANRADLNDIIKKASMPIQHRPGSDWTDNAYLLVAWARHYQMQFDEAALTFKYVNSTSKDPNAKHEALIGLMQNFIATKDFDNAKAVSDILDKEQGLPDDARELFLTRADYYLKTGEPDKAIPQLEKAIPLIDLKNERSRTRYILAQLYQAQGEDKKAYEQLDQLLSRNPPYELDFQAKLMLGQVSDLNQRDKARQAKYFAKLLKDRKNVDYRDKVYYEMARYSYRQQNYADALDKLRQSARATTTNRSQKSYTYLLAGRIYYENLQKYRLAAAYYDSTVQNMTPAMAHYDATKERADILKRFAEQYTVIETQDSLQALARLSPDELSQRLNTYATAEIAAKKLAAEKAAAAAKAAAEAAEFASRKATNIGAGLPGSTNSPVAGLGPDPTAFDPNAPGGAKWYFDNPATLATARADFVRRWGDRGLNDNWRTNSQAGADPTDAPAAALAATRPQLSPEQQAEAARQDSIKQARANDPEAQRADLVAGYRAALPLTPPQVAESDQKVEQAMYLLGGIYKEELKETDKGYETYETQVGRYPRGEHAPDAYYLLYLHYKDLPDAAKAAQYAAALQREFPKSIYAKLVADPLYREHEQALTRAVAARLDSAFTLYKKQEFTKARGALDALEKQYPKSTLADQVAYLRTLLVIRTQPPRSARSSVEQFYKDYPESPLVPQAQALADTYKKREAGEISGALASTEKPLISVFRPGEVNNRMRIAYAEGDSPIGPAAPAAPTPSPAPAAQPGTSAPAPTPAPAPGGSPAPAPGGAPAPAGMPAPSGSPAPAPAGTPAPAGSPAPVAGAPAPGGSPTPASPAGLAPAPGSSAAAPTPAAAPASLYTADQAAPHTVLILFPKAAPPAPTMAAQFGTYNGRYYRTYKLQTQAQPLGTDKEALIISELPNAKLAQSYATKLRGPQSPLARLRGQGYEAIIISQANLAALQAGGDLAAYLTFYQGEYK